MRRRAAGIVATVVAATALAIIPLNLGSAFADGTPSQQALASLNTDRQDGKGDPAFLDNGFVDDYAGAVAQGYASCDGCNNPAYVPWTTLSPDNATTSFATVSGGVLADRVQRAVADIESRDADNAYDSDTYGSFGFYTRGSTTFVALVTASFSSTPLNETRTGSVKLPAVVRVGQPIVPVISGFSPLPISGYTYTWTDGGTVVSHTDNYMPTANEIGHLLRVTVEDQNPGYSDGLVLSPVSSKVLVGILRAPATVVVTGARNVGETLSVSNLAAWGGTPAAQWYRNGVAIPSATEYTYVQASADRGKKISLRLTDTYAGYTTVVRTSAATLVTGYPFLTSAPYPVITGTPNFGTTLVADVGVWGPGSPKLTYVWRVNGSVIAGATHQDLLLGAAELNGSVTVTVTGSETGYAAVARESAPTIDVAMLEFASKSEPSVIGTLAPGHVVTAFVNPWTPVVSEYLYQWYLNNAPVAGANKKTFTLPAAAAGEDVRVNVIGIRADYQPTEYTSINNFVS